MMRDNREQKLKEGKSVIIISDNIHVQAER